MQKKLHSCQHNAVKRAYLDMTPHSTPQVQEGVPATEGDMATPDGGGIHRDKAQQQVIWGSPLVCLAVVHLQDQTSIGLHRENHNSHNFLIRNDSDQHHQY